jgi:hypothetical protein
MGRESPLWLGPVLEHPWTGEDPLSMTSENMEFSEVPGFPLVPLVAPGAARVREPRALHGDETPAVALWAQPEP